MSVDLQPFTLGPVQAGPACCEPTPLFQVRNLSVAYDEKIVLDQVSLDIYKGCITALIGPSGCGKTSFLSCLNRIIDLSTNCKTSGSVNFQGDNILAIQSLEKIALLRQKIGLIFQKPNPFPLSIRANLELALKEHGVGSRKTRDEKIKKALLDVGLWDEVAHRLNSSALGLSGGQQQRLCIARALVLEPEVLLLDEPCSALDPIASTVVEQLIKSLAGRYTVIIVTHNLAQARRIANYAAFFWMTESVGKLIEFGRSQQVFDEPSQALTKAYVAGMQG
jgi:phosphate transport system ATP-binding protein